MFSGLIARTAFLCPPGFDVDRSLGFDLDRSHLKQRNGACMLKERAGIEKLGVWRLAQPRRGEGIVYSSCPALQQACPEGHMTLLERRIYSAGASLSSAHQTVQAFWHWCALDGDAPAEYILLSRSVMWPSGDACCRAGHESAIICVLHFCLVIPLKNKGLVLREGSVKNTTAVPP